MSDTTRPDLLTRLEELLAKATPESRIARKTRLALLRDLWEPCLVCDCDFCCEIRPRVEAALASEPGEPKP